MKCMKCRESSPAQQLIRLERNNEDEKYRYICWSCHMGIVSATTAKYMEGKL